MNKFGWLLPVCLVVTAFGFSEQGQVPFVPALAYGGAPTCPENPGVRWFRSEVASRSSTRVSISGSTVRQSGGVCVYKTQLDIGDRYSRSIPLSDAGRAQYSVIDFSPAGPEMLVAKEMQLEYPNEQHNNVSVALMKFNTGQPRWTDLWRLFEWGDCDATVDAQGFTSGGQVVLLVRPSIMRPKRRADCVDTEGLYETDLVSKPLRLAENLKVQRYGQRLEPAEVPCKTDPDVIEVCFRIHGRLALYNGGPSLRIWPIGTRRILGIPEDFQLPASLEGLDWDREAWADFTVCPLTRERPGVMRMVCVDSAQHVVFKGR